MNFDLYRVADLAAQRGQTSLDEVAVLGAVYDAGALCIGRGVGGEVGVAGLLMRLRTVYVVGGGVVGEWWWRGVGVNRCSGESAAGINTIGYSEDPRVGGR